MVFVVKYFRRNQFQKKLFSRKYFLAFGLQEKITKRENAVVAGIWQRRPAVVGFRPDQWPGPVITGRISTILARSGQILPESGLLASGDCGRMSPASGDGIIPVLSGSGQLTIAGFGQSDIKRACNNNEYNFGKRFTVFKT
jgi:hypothetical protein